MNRRRFLALLIAGSFAGCADRLRTFQPEPPAGPEVLDRYQLDGLLIEGIRWTAFSHLETDSNGVVSPTSDVFLSCTLGLFAVGPGPGHVPIELYEMPIRMNAERFRPIREFREGTPFHAIEEPRFHPPSMPRERYLQAGTQVPLHLIYDTPTPDQPVIGLDPIDRSDVALSLRRVEPADSTDSELDRS